MDRSAASSGRKKWSEVRKSPAAPVRLCCGQQHLGALCPKDTEKMSLGGQALIAGWLLADMIGMVVMALLHVSDWVFPIGAFAPLVAPIFFISAIGYGGE